MQKEAQELLEEIGHKMALPAVRSLALVLRSVLRRILKGVFVNKPGLEKVGSYARVLVYSLCAPPLDHVVERSRATVARGSATFPPLLSGLYSCHISHV